MAGLITSCACVMKVHWPVKGCETDEGDQITDGVRECNVVDRACGANTKHCRLPTTGRPRTACNAKNATCPFQ